jgi:hypothetical protein
MNYCLMFCGPIFIYILVGLTSMVIFFASNAHAQPPAKPVGCSGLLASPTVLI